ncbi:actin cytoskeleton-regulatory complex protein pan1-like [Neltuma alba]|uniref:actin cytoskeleton-regulatory complex protein pan1-like n=1 Tax=Neltuma alba TaxID=207710 RepID=UPI0010A340C4|nr:actin cytoskeleton-regulatory complex protein pan1-like [Prosopis alba]
MARVKQPNVEREEGLEKQTEKQPALPRKSPRSKSKLLVVTEESETESDDRALVQKAVETALRIPIPKQLRQKKQRASEGITRQIPSKSIPSDFSELLVGNLDKEANNIAPFEPGESKTKVPAFGITQLHKMRIPLPFRPSQKVPQKDKGKQLVVSTSRTQDEAESTAAPSHAPGPSFMERSLREMFQAELQEFEKRVYVTAREYGEVSDRKFEEKFKSSKGMEASLCNNFFAPSTTFSFEDLLHHPPSPPHHKPGPSTSIIPPSPSVPSTSPTPSPTLALITVPQPVPSIHIPSLSPLSHFPPLPIPLSIPPVSTSSSSPPDADKKGEKNSDS